MIQCRYFGDVFQIPRRSGRSWRNWADRQGDGRSLKLTGGRADIDGVYADTVLLDAVSRPE